MKTIVLVLSTCVVGCSQIVDADDLEANYCKADACDYSCVDMDVQDQLDPVILERPAAGAGDDTAGGCGLVAGEDIAVTWTAPFDDEFYFTSKYSDHETTLYIRDDCGGENLACVAATPPTGGYVDPSPSTAALHVAFGQTLTVVVESAAGATGTVRLGICTSLSRCTPPPDPVPCPDGMVCGPESFCLTGDPPAPPACNLPGFAPGTECFTTGTCVNDGLLGRCEIPCSPPEL